MVGLFPRACRARLVNRHPAPVLSDLPLLRDKILSKNCAPDSAQPRSKSEAVLTRDPASSRRLGQRIVGSTCENARRPIAFQLAISFPGPVALDGANDRSGDGGRAGGRLYTPKYQNLR